MPKFYTKKPKKKKQYLWPLSFTLNCLRTKDAGYKGVRATAMLFA